MRNSLDSPTVPGGRRAVSREIATLAALVPTLVLALLATGCSIERMAARALSDALEESAAVYAEDDDPEFVAAALPFALKTNEALIRSDPENPALLLSACSGFTQYGYAFLDAEAARLRSMGEVAEARRLDDRALGLYLRARGYCLRALDARFDDDSARALRIDPAALLERATRDDVPFLFWTAASWGSAIGKALHRPDLLVDFPVVKALLERALELDEAWDDGSLHETLLIFAAMPEAMGGSEDAARRHYQRAVELSGDRRVSTHVSWATQFAVPRQDREAFDAAIARALAIDVDASPPDRLANVVARRTALRLRSQADTLILPPLEPEEGTP